MGYGCLGLTGLYNSPVSDEHGISIITQAFLKGITFFDTADVYGPHSNEILIGKVYPFSFLFKGFSFFYKCKLAGNHFWMFYQALKQLPREKIQLASKFGIEKFDGRSVVINGRPEYVRACCEASLKRLDVAYIDLYYQHRVDKSVPIEDTVRTCLMYLVFSSQF